MKQRLTCLDLFCGAGGLSKGFLDALKVGAAIVAEEHEKARKWLAEMQNVKREEFLHFPIANLLSKQ